MDILQRIEQFKAHIDEGGTYTQEVVLEMISELQAENERYRVALEDIANQEYVRVEGLEGWIGNLAEIEIAQQALTKETK